jgi:hypothetical protein
VRDWILRWVPAGITALVGAVGAFLLRKRATMKPDARPSFPAAQPAAPASAALAPVVGALSAQPVPSLTASTPWAYYMGMAAIAKRRGWDPVGMMQIQYSESTIEPEAVHRNADGVIVAVGLIQFNGSLPGLGWTAGNAAFALLPAAAQLPYVEKYYANKPMPVGSNGTAFYLANYEPAKLRHWQNSEYVLDTPTDGTGFYAAQAATFDVSPRKGYITVGDLTRRLARVCVGATWREHVARLEWAVQSQGGTGLDLTIAASAVAVLVAGAVSWAYVQDHPEWLSQFSRSMRALVGA